VKAVLALAAVLAASSAAVAAPRVETVRPRDVAVACDEGGTCTVDVTSATGIGGLRLARGAEPWPARIVVRFRYEDGRPFTRLEGCHVRAGALALEVRPGEAAGGGGIDVRQVARDGAVWIELVLAPGRPERVDEIGVDWVDFYR
jgi:hypothetical protein